MLNYYSSILLGTLKIQTNLLQLATKISWNIPVCSPFKLQQQHQENEGYVSTRLYPHVWEATDQLYHSGEAMQGEISVALPALCDMWFFSPDKNVQWLIFHSATCEKAQFKHHLSEIRSSLDKSRENIHTTWWKPMWPRHGTKATTGTIPEYTNTKTTPDLYWCFPSANWELSIA